MLTYDQVTIVEGIYLAIESGGISNEFAIELRNYIHKQNYEQHIYLQWLFNRWSFIKLDMDHMPMRNLSLSLAISRYHNLQPTVCNVITQNEPNIFY